MKFIIKNNSSSLIVNCSGQAIWVNDIEKALKKLFMRLDLEKTAAEKLIINLTNNSFVSKNTNKAFEIIINKFKQKVELVNEQRIENIKLVVASNNDKKNQAMERLGLKEVITFTDNLADAINFKTTSGPD